MTRAWLAHKPAQARGARDASACRHARCHWQCSSARSRQAWRCGLRRRWQGRCGGRCERVTRRCERVTRRCERVTRRCERVTGLSRNSNSASAASVSGPSFPASLPRHLTAEVVIHLTEAIRAIALLLIVFPTHAASPRSVVIALAARYQLVLRDVLEKRQTPRPRPRQRQTAAK
eukprot:3126373-Rhodomonas_salina.4